MNREFPTSNMYAIVCVCVCVCAIYPNIVIVSAVRKANICTFTHIILTQRASLSFVIYGFGWKCGVVFFLFLQFILLFFPMNQSFIRLLYFKIFNTFQVWSFQ